MVNRSFFISCFYSGSYPNRASAVSCVWVSKKSPVEIPGAGHGLLSQCPDWGNDCVLGLLMSVYYLGGDLPYLPFSSHSTIKTGLLFIPTCPSPFKNNDLSPQTRLKLTLILENYAISPIAVKVTGPGSGKNCRGTETVSKQLNQRRIKEKYGESRTS